MVVNTEHRFVVRDDDILGGEPIIKGTRTPVRAVVEYWRLGVPPEEISSHLLHVDLAQIFDALSYFAAHQEEIQSLIDQNAVPDDLSHPASHPQA